MARKVRRDTVASSKPRGYRASPPSHNWAPPLGVGIATFLVFLPTIRNDFVSFDDHSNFLTNLAFRGLGLDQLRWMWTTFHLGHWVPLSWMSLGLDYVVWGMNPLGYHLTNVILHSAVACIAYVIAQRLLPAGQGVDQEGGLVRRILPPSFAALVFAVHPLRVESVAWITERRDMLSLLFALASLLWYLRACEPPQLNRRAYLISLGLFICALLSKATVVTLPAVLLIVDRYPLNRIGGSRGWLTRDARRVYLEKIPYVALAACISIVSLTALPSRPQLSILGKIAVMAYGLMFYLQKTLFPYNLSPLYSLPVEVSPVDGRYAADMALAVAIAALAWVFRNRRPGITAALLAFVVITLPLLGVVQNGPQIAADRYTYHGSLALTILAACVVRRFAKIHPMKTLGASCALVLALAMLTIQQTQVWRNSTSLWTRVVTVEPRSSNAHNGLG